MTRTCPHERTLTLTHTQSNVILHFGNYRVCLTFRWIKTVSSAFLRYTITGPLPQPQRRSTIATTSCRWQHVSTIDARLDRSGAIAQRQPRLLIKAVWRTRGGREICRRRLQITDALRERERGSGKQSCRRARVYINGRIYDRCSIYVSRPPVLAAMSTNTAQLWRIPS